MTPKISGEACRLDLGLIPYAQAWALQQELVAQKKSGSALPEVLILLEHPPVLTLGRWGKTDHVLKDPEWLKKKGIDLVRTDRGGQVTYHGPGQLVGYPIFDLKRLGLGIREYAQRLEEVLIRTLSEYGVSAGRREECPGVWLGREKIASLGLAVQQGISFHGFALNYGVDLKAFDWINPCGLPGVRMTSLDQILKGPLEADRLRETVARHFEEVFRLRWVSPGPFEKIIQNWFENCKKNDNNPEVDRSYSASSTDDDHQRDLVGRPGSVRPRPPSVHPKPFWLKKKITGGSNILRVKGLVQQEGLHTVCQEARCPNQGECFSCGTATFLLMGNGCTRNCGYCAVRPGRPEPLDPQEPERIARAVQQLDLKYAVLTSVTRDDLADGGAAHFTNTVLAVRRTNPGIRVECLIPDFLGAERALSILGESRPEVVNHNLETVPRLYATVRPGANFRRSLSIFWFLKKQFPGILTKSGIILGLGEEEKELYALFQDLRERECDLLTIGQYLQPSAEHLPVKRYLPPEAFEHLAAEALKMGFKAVASGPYVRSSFQAAALYHQAVDGGAS